MRLPLQPPPELPVLPACFVLFCLHFKKIEAPHLARAGTDDSCLHVHLPPCPSVGNQAGQGGRTSSHARTHTHAHTTLQEPRAQAVWLQKNVEREKASSTQARGRPGVGSWRHRIRTPPQSSSAMGGTRRQEGPRCTDSRYHARAQPKPCCSVRLVDTPLQIIKLACRSAYARLCAIHPHSKKRCCKY